MKVGQPCEQCSDGDLAFQTRQRRAQAVVDALTEGNVASGYAADLKMLRLRERVGIVICCRQQEENMAAPGNSHARDDQILCGIAIDQLYRIDKAQQLL